MSAPTAKRFIVIKLIFSHSGNEGVGWEGREYKQVFKAEYVVWAGSLEAMLVDKASTQIKCAC